MAHLLLQTEAKCCEKKMQMPSSIFHIGSSSLCWQLSLLLQNIDRSDRPQLFVGQYALSNRKAALHEEKCPNGHSSSSYRETEVYQEKCKKPVFFPSQKHVHCVNKCCMASPHFRMKRQHPLRRNAKWVVLTLQVESSPQGIIPHSQFFTSYRESAFFEGKYLFTGPPPRRERLLSEEKLWVIRFHLRKYDRAL